MKWTWDQFGFEPPERDPSKKIETLLKNLIPGAEQVSIQVVGAARDAMLLKLAVAGPIPAAIDAQVLRQLASSLDVREVQLIPASDDPETFIARALQPAEVEQVMLCDMIGRAIVIVCDDQLLSAIGPNSQHVRLASKLTGWDIEIMTAIGLAQQIEAAVACFSSLDGVSPELAEQLVEQGYLSYDDLSVIEPDSLMALGNLTAEDVDQIVEQAERLAEEEAGGRN